MNSATVERAMLLALLAIVLSFATIAPGLGRNNTAEATITTNVMLASFIAETGTAKDLKYIEYQTKTTKSNPYLGIVSCTDPPDLPGWCNFRYTDGYFVNGVGNDNRWYQCAVKYVVSAQKWTLDWEVFDSSGQKNHIHLGTIPKDTNVNIKLGVASYTGSSGVSCVVSWSGGSVSFVDSYNPASFKRTPSAVNGKWHTSVLSEYSDRQNLTPSTLGTVTYTPIKLVDTSGTTTTVTKVTQLISDSVNHAQFSGPSTLPKTFTYPPSTGYTVSTTSTGKVTTT